MNYENPELLDQLAPAYVLGTLRGPARRRFTRLMRTSMAVQRAVWRWERELIPLGEAAEPRQPAPAVWEGIEARLGLSEPARARFAWLWPGATAALAAALLVLVLLPAPPQQPPTGLTVSERLALIQDSEQQPLWVVTVDEETGTLSSIAVNAPAAVADRVFELWMLPAQGAPRSFGLLPAYDRGRGSRTLSPTLLALLSDAQGLAVSLEPVGGSPTGAPTGPVLYSAPVIGL